MSKDYSKLGLENKYIIQKADGSEVDPHADYFVLRLDKDKAAREAAHKYAVECDNMQLRKDLILKMMDYEVYDEFVTFYNVLTGIVKDLVVERVFGLTEYNPEEFLMSVIDEGIDSESISVEISDMDGNVCRYETVYKKEILQKLRKKIDGGSEGV